MNTKQEIVDKLNELAQEIQNTTKDIKTLNVVVLNGKLVLGNIEYSDQPLEDYEITEEDLKKVII